PPKSGLLGGLPQIVDEHAGFITSGEKVNADLQIERSNQQKPSRLRATSDPFYNQVIAVYSWLLHHPGKRTTHHNKTLCRRRILTRFVRILYKPVVRHPVRTNNHNWIMTSTYVLESDKLYLNAGTALQRRYTKHLHNAKVVVMYFGDTLPEKVCGLPNKYSVISEGFVEKEKPSDQDETRPPCLY
ncbi:unnamed protein product, partial [Trichogramma brassicae]